MGSNFTIYKYGNRSARILSGADEGLQKVFNTAIKLGLIDISILQSIRDKEEQNAYFNATPQKSKVQWPDSKHNILNPDDKSEAIDAAPYVNGKASFDYRHCIFLAGIVCGLGRIMGINIRWGGNWDMDGEPMTDQDFQDLVHFERVR